MPSDQNTIQLWNVTLRSATGYPLCQLADAVIHLDREGRKWGFESNYSPWTIEAGTAWLFSSSEYSGRITALDKSSGFIGRGEGDLVGFSWESQDPNHL